LTDLRSICFRRACQSGAALPRTLHVGGYRGRVVALSARLAFLSSMTTAEFSAFFWSTVNTLPQEMRNCLTRYAQECVTAELFVNDQAVFRAEKRMGLDWVPAIMEERNGYWTFAFRPVLLDAPKEVFETIIRHELLHAFLYAVNGMPTPEAAKLYKRFQERLEAKYAAAGRQPNSDYHRQEELIELMNEEFGGDEKVARDWVIANRQFREPDRSRS
jgi:hypothetical protein